MPTTPFHIYELQASNTRGWPDGPSIMSSGGAFIVTVAGSPDKAVLYDAEALTPISNPVAMSRGKLRFATLATVLAVDIYGFAPDGSFVAMRGVRPGAESEIFADSQAPHQCAVIPFHFSDFTINAEQDTGLDFPAGALVLPTTAARVTALDAGITMQLGLLASESGGDADGFMAAVSMANLGTVVPGLAAIQGALLFENFATTPAVRVPRSHPIGTAVSISLTFSAGADTAAGFFYLPYIKLVN